MHASHNGYGENINQHYIRRRVHIIILYINMDRNFLEGGTGYTTEHTRSFFPHTKLKLALKMF